MYGTTSSVRHPGRRVRTLLEPTEVDQVDAVPSAVRDRDIALNITSNASGTDERECDLINPRSPDSLTVAVVGQRR
jgi:hypothetical protein